MAEGDATGLLVAEPVGAMDARHPHVRPEVPRGDAALDSTVHREADVLAPGSAAHW